jgi:hypothetical protein
VSNPGWRYHIEGDTPYHVWPANDLIEHDTDDDNGDCPCGPRATPVEADDGSIGWIYTHHSLDGREQDE